MIQGISQIVKSWTMVLVTPKLDLLKMGIQLMLKIEARRLKTIL